MLFSHCNNTLGPPIAISTAITSTTIAVMIYKRRLYLFQKLIPERNEIESIFRVCFTQYLHSLLQETVQFTGNQVEPLSFNGSYDVSCISGLLSSSIVNKDNNARALSCNSFIIKHSRLHLKNSTSVT